MIPIKKEGNLNCNHLSNHLAIVSSNAIIAPCCQFKDFRQPNKYKTVFNQDSLDDVLTSGFWQSVRDNLEKGTKIPSCSGCWANEEAGGVSKRQWANSSMEVLHPNTVEDLEIGLDYTCNMMCRICKPAQSSKWNQAPVTLKLYARRPAIYNTIDNVKDYQTKLRSLVENSNLKNVRRIRLVGGEPFYSKNFEWFINKVAAETDIAQLDFAVNTNGSIVPKDSVLEKFFQMKTVRIDFSIDSVGDLASCTRWGVEWSAIETNIKRWVQIAKSHKNIKLSVHSTISILNINRIQEIVDFCDDNNLVFGFSNLEDPDYLNYCQIPPELRNAWTVSSSKQDSYLVTDLNTSITKNTMSKNKLYDFLYFTEVMDQYQGLTFSEVNPEIVEIAKRLK
jgi:organic radical activating enzyme